MNNKFKITIGDWSDDGHGKSDEIIFESNATLKEMQDAYRQSCRTTGIQFHGYDHRNDYSNGIEICVNYEDSSPPIKAVDIMIAYGIIDISEYGDDFDKEDFYFDGGEEFAEYIMKFIGISIPGFQFKKISDEIPPLNGWWGDLNHSFGYGLYF